MIQLTCTKCQTVLTIDEAFAGGVCRCQHCGTIQTVPSQLKKAATQGKTSSKIKQQRSRILYQKQDEPAQSGSGLDELGQIVASSGLTSSRLRQPPPRQAVRQSSSRPEQPGQREPSKPTPPTKPSLVLRIAQALKAKPVLTSAIAAGVLTLLLAVWMLTSSKQIDLATTPAKAPSSGETTSASATNPDFMGIPLSGKRIIYVLDRGSASQQSFSLTLEATYRSIASLGTQREFRIIFWDTGKLEAYPIARPVSATPENLAAARAALAGIVAWGSSDAKPALESAVANHPDEIILVTAKGWDLDENFVTMVKTVLTGTDTRVNTLSIGEASSALQSISQSSGGQAIALKISELQAAIP